MSPTTVTSAVTASDPRVTEVLTVKVGESGLARVMSLVVALSGDEPVSTETVVNIAVAAVENAKSDIDELKLMARPAADPSAILDLSAAAEGLPADVEWVWLSSSLQFIGPDAAAIGGGR